MCGPCQASEEMNVLLNGVCEGFPVFRYPPRQYSPAKDNEPYWHNHQADRDQDRAAKTLDKTGERETCVSRRPRCEALVLCERPAVPSDQLQSAMLALRGPIARLPRCQPLQVASSILMRLAGPQAAQLSHVVRRQTSTDLATQRASPSLLLLGMGQAGHADSTPRLTSPFKTRFMSLRGVAVLSMGQSNLSQATIRLL